MTETNKSYLVAVIIIAALLACIFLFARAGLEARTEDSGNAAPTEAATAERMAARPEPALVRGVDNTSPGGNPRMRWLDRWRRDMTRKGWSLRASARGQGAEILVLSWGRDRSAQDNAHIEALKKAEGFMAQLRGLKFTRLVLTVEGEPVWSKDLRSDRIRRDR